MAAFNMDRLLGQNTLVLKTIRLENHNNTTNTHKFYEIIVEQNYADQLLPFRVSTRYGRVGAKNPVTQVYRESQSEQGCLRMAEELATTKVRTKGYKRV